MDINCHHFVTLSEINLQLSFLELLPRPPLTLELTSFLLHLFCSLICPQGTCPLEQEGQHLSQETARVCYGGHTEVKICGFDKHEALQQPISLGS